MSATTIPSIVTPGARAIAAHTKVSDTAAQAEQHAQAAQHGQSAQHGPAEAARLASRETKATGVERVGARTDVLV